MHYNHDGLLLHTSDFEAQDLIAKHVAKGFHYTKHDGELGLWSPTFDRMLGQHTAWGWMFNPSLARALDNVGSADPTNCDACRATARTLARRAKETL